MGLGAAGDLPEFTRKKTGAKMPLGDLVQQYQLYVADVLADRDSEPAGALLALIARDRLAEEWSRLSPQLRHEVTATDKILIRKWRRVRASIPPGRTQDRSRWWWFLHEGPQAREKAMTPGHEGEATV